MSSSQVILNFGNGDKIKIGCQHIQVSHGGSHNSDSPDRDLVSLEEGRRRIQKH